MGEDFSQIHEMVEKIESYRNLLKQDHGARKIHNITENFQINQNNSHTERMSYSEDFLFLNKIALCIRELSPSYHKYVYYIPCLDLLFITD